MAGLRIELAFALAVAGCGGGAAPAPVATASTPAQAVNAEGQWAFAVLAADGTAPRTATATRATTVTIAVNCVCARNPDGRPATIESREVSHTFAEGTIDSDIAGFLADLLKDRLAGLAIQVDYEPGLESVFVGGADLAGIAGGSEDDAVIRIGMSCTVGPAEGRRIAVPASATEGR